MKMAPIITIKIILKFLSFLFFFKKIFGLEFVLKILFLFILKFIFSLTTIHELHDKNNTFFKFQSKLT